MAPAGELVADLEDRREAIVAPLLCSTWSCACCSWRLVKRNRARAFLGVTGAERVALITLTVDPESPAFQEVVGYYRDAGAGGPHGIFPVASIDYVRAIAWKRFRTYLAREFGRVPWLRGVELTRAGIAHVHVVVPLASLAEFWRLRSLVRGAEAGRAARRGGWSRSVAQSPARRDYGLAERAGFGIVSDVLLARSNGDVARYVAKATTDHAEASGPELAAVVDTPGYRPGAAYAVKGAADRRMPKFTRRVSWSGGKAPWAPSWRKRVPVSGFTWRVAPASASTVAPALERSGYVLVDPDRVRSTAGGVPAGGGVPC